MYGLPLWTRTMNLSLAIVETSAMEVMTLRFEELQANTTLALEPVMDFLGTDAQLKSAP